MLVVSTVKWRHWDCEFLGILASFCFGCGLNNWIFMTFTSTFVLSLTGLCINPMKTALLMNTSQTVWHKHRLNRSILWFFHPYSFLPRVTGTTAHYLGRPRFKLLVSGTLFMLILLTADAFTLNDKVILLWRTRHSHWSWFEYKKRRAS